MIKFICSSSTLLKHLQSVGSVISSSNPLEILNDVLLRINPGELLITGSDLETTITSKLPIDCSETASLAIPAKMLIDSLKTFPEQPLTFTIDQENHSMEISSDNGRYKFQGHNAEDFPKITENPGSSTVVLPAPVLLEAINKTLFATGNDDIRPVMSGVLCQLSPESVTFVATDAHKLVRYRRHDASSEQSASLILPKKPLTILKNILGSNAETRVNIDFTDQNCYFTFENYQVYCRLIEGKYPNYEAVIPSDNPNKMNIDRLTLLSAIKRVSIFASKSTNQIRLKITGSELLISAEDVDFSSSANERMTCQYSGEDMEIGFNSKFINEMLSNLSSEEVVVEMSAPNRAGLILPANSTNEHENVLMLVMPVMLNN